ncbi:MAG TPA: FAD-binding oxidoreductase [Aggregatilineales bacterium]|nr:FAD-binding oxidoreductase [Aggregatilineales bacterium]
MNTQYTRLDSTLIEQLTQIAGAGNISAASADRNLYAHDQSQHDAQPPEVVIWGVSTQQISAVMAFASKHCIPVTPWGAGTSIEGNPIPVHGGILLTMDHMKEIIEVYPDDFQVTVQPGIGHYDLNKQLSRYGLFFPPDPGANASIGGMLANNAAGIRTVRYGASKDNVLRMEVVLADGRVIQVGSRSVKQSSGYDLLHLFVGSEGTLGIITEATLKLAPIAAQLSAVLAHFPTIQAAVETVIAIRGSGLNPAALELIDAPHAEMLNQADGVELEPLPTLFMEFQDNDKDTLERGLTQTREICMEMGASSFRATTDPTERANLWHARHTAYEIQQRNFPGKKIYVGDIAVPISKIAEMSQFIEDRLAQDQTAGYLVGHAGDGNIHLTIPYEGEQEYKRARAINADMVEKALLLGGTATGEHGVGITKRVHMEREHGAALDVMRAVKNLFDPGNILNPGKIFP